MMRTWSATGLTVPLESIADSGGDQSAGSVDLGAFGVWTITAGVSTDVEVDEVSVILAGRGTVEDLDTGATVELAPGTVLRLAAGVRTRWTVIERSARSTSSTDAAAPCSGSEGHCARTPTGGAV